MHRTILILVACASLCFCGRATKAEDYLLRLEAIEYVGAPGSDSESEGRVLYSMEVITQPYDLFHNRVAVDSRTLTLTGRLRPSDRGVYSVQIDFLDSKPSGITITKDDGTLEPQPEITSFMTTAGIAVGEHVTVSTISTKTFKNGEPMQQSTIRFVLSLSEFKSA